MSTIRSNPGQADRPQPQGNPFFYGFRDVVSTDEQGKHKVERQALTREDVLHPREGDHVTQNTDHDKDCDYLCDVVRAQVRQEPATVVYHDVLINWGIPGLGGHGPDLVLFRGLRDPQRRRDSFNVAEEGVRPELIIEVTSPSTRAGDLNDKVREYFQAQVPVYVILDEQFRRGQRRLRIIPYRRGPRAYRRQRLDARGWFWLEAVQLWLGQENGRAALYDAQGHRLEGYVEVVETLQREAEARRQAEQARDREAEARQTAEQENARLQAELRRLRGEE